MKMESGRGNRGVSFDPGNQAGMSRTVDERPNHGVFCTSKGKERGGGVWTEKRMARKRNRATGRKIFYMF